MDNLRHLRYFVTLVHTNHMSRAAEQLGIAQSSLSYAIHKLEQQLNAPLIEPDGRNIKLTRMGAIFLPYAEQALDALDTGEHVIARLMARDQGQVNIGFIYSVGHSLVPTLVSQFQQHYPATKFQFSEDLTPAMLHALDAGKYDVVFGSMVSEFNHQPANEAFTFQLIGEQEIKLAVPVNHPLAKKTHVTLHDVEHYPLVSYTPECGMFRLIKQIFKDGHISPDIRLRLTNEHNIIGFVKSNHMAALIPDLQEAHTRDITLRTITDHHRNHHVYMITKRNGFLTPTAQSFIHFAGTYCNQHFVFAQNFL